MQTELSSCEMLSCISKILEKKGVEVSFVNTNKEGIEIAALKNGKIIVNITSRDELSIIFTIAHLFGHLCQFQNYERYRDIVEHIQKNIPIILSNDFKDRFWEYEKEAFGIGKSLMMESFPVSERLDQQYQTFMITDFDHFWNYIKTGTKEGIKEFNKLLKINYKKNLKFNTPVHPVPIPSCIEVTAFNVEVSIV